MIFITLIVLLSLSKKAACQLAGDVEVAKYDEFKYLVYVEAEFNYPSELNLKAEKYYGGGVIVTYKWVLTCAHNFDAEVKNGRSYEPDVVTVLAGAKNRTDEEGRGSWAQKRAVGMTAVLVHEEWQKDERFDIALIYLGGNPLKESGRVREANLVASASWRSDFYEVPMMIVGWGSFEVDASGKEVEADVARKGSVLMRPAPFCEKNLDKMKFDGNFHFCYGCRGCKGCSMTASGDSGSPVVQIQNGEEVVVGVQAASKMDLRRNCSEKYPGMAVDVGKFRGWMEKEMGRREWQHLKGWLAWKAGAVLGTAGFCVLCARLFV